MSAPESFTATERFKLIRQIGAGGMGVVWEAIDLEGGARVALKTFHEYKPALLFHLKQEFRALAEIRHPNLVAFYEMIATGPRCFFTMEYVEGADLLSFVRQGRAAYRASANDITATQSMSPSSMPAIPATGPGPLDSPEQWKRLREVLPQLARGVMALHRAGKLHRDIKPNNALVTPEGRVVLLDFGLATDARFPGLHRERRVQGTSGYIAPEVLAGEAPSPASDFFAVGSLLCKLITGRVPGAHRGSSSVDDVASWAEDLFQTVHGPAAESDLVELAKSLLNPLPRVRANGADILRTLGAKEEEQSVPEPPVLIGRGRYLQALATALEHVEKGESRTIYLHGESGAGKSELCNYFLQSIAARPNVVILNGRCYVQESVPYKALDSLIDSLTRYLNTLPAVEVAALLPRDVAALARIFPLLRTLPVVAEAPARDLATLGDRELRRRAGGALRELLGRLADRKLLVLFIDDLQWGDEDSAIVLLDILSGADVPRFLFMASYRSEFAKASPCLELLLNSGGPVENLLVDALQPEDAKELALRLLGTNARDSAAEAVVREAGGNTYLLTELARSFRRPQGDETAGAASLDALLQRRTAALPESCRRLLEIVAVSDRPLPQGAAFRAAQLSGSDPDTLSLLRAGRFVRTSGQSESDGIQVFHDRIRETILAHLAKDTLRAHHISLASVLERTPGTDPETLAVHLDGAGEAERAGRYYQQAADRAAAALAFRHAARLYERALALRDVRGAERVVLERRWADSLANAGRGIEAARIYERAASEVAPAEALELERLAAYQFCISGRVDEGIAAFGSVLRRVNLRLPSTYGKAALAFLFARLRLTLRGLRFRERQESAIAPELRARIDAAWAAATGLGMVHLVNAAYLTTRSLLLALDAGDPVRIARSLAWEAATSGYFGESGRKRAGRLFHVCESLVERTHNPYCRGLLDMSRGIVEYSSGRWKQGLVLLAGARKIFETQCTGATWELATTKVFSQLLLVNLGEFGQLAESCPPILRDAAERGDLYSEVLIGVTAQTSWHCGLDRPERALQSSNEYLARWSRKSIDTPQFVGMVNRWFVRLYLGDYANSWAEMREGWKLAEKGGMLRGDFTRSWALWLRAITAVGAARGAADPQPLLREADSAVRRLRKEAIRFAPALADSAAACLAVQRGRMPEAIELLRNAMREAEASDMVMLYQSARMALGRYTNDAALMDASQEWMRLHGIVNPSRMAAAHIVTLGKESNE